MNNRHVGGGGGRGDGGTIRAWRIYAQSQRQRTTTTLEDRESRSRQTDSASPPGCIPFPLSLSLCMSSSPDIPIAVPICLLCRALGFTLPSLSFSFSLLASLRFALLCSPALFALASSAFIVGYSPDSPRSVAILCADCTLTPARGGQPELNCESSAVHTHSCVCVSVCVSEVYLAKGDRVVLTSKCCIVNDFTD